MRYYEVLTEAKSQIARQDIIRLGDDGNIYVAAGWTILSKIRADDTMINEWTKTDDGQHLTRIEPESDYTKPDCF